MKSRGGSGAAAKGTSKEKWKERETLSRSEHPRAARASRQQQREMSLPLLPLLIAFSTYCLTDGSLSRIFQAIAQRQGEKFAMLPPVSKRTAPH